MGRNTPSYRAQNSLFSRDAERSADRAPLRVAAKQRIGGIAMARWLFKSEPSCYSFDDLRRDGATLWDGITNALARKHLRSVRPGDQILFYHTGDEKAVVGIMKAASGPQPDPHADDEKAVAIE